ncbi:hypothetical protein [Chitinivorax sp. B]|uniref:hypothetical protein n=1 Tax=Chitinivorax sp. B TaxID=2502235 RepID=UPI0010F868A8|nr:hypothetical protein [Chitinivorax sp. B]
MDIQDVFAIKRWTPISDLTSSGNSFDKLGNSLYIAGENIYILVSPYKEGCLVSNPQAPFIAGILWACEPGAALRAITMEIEEDKGSVVPIPISFLPNSCLPTYGAIRDTLMEIMPNGCIEAGSYRIASDGAFVHRKLDSREYTFFFRNPKGGESEEPYAALYKLPPKTS